MRDPKEWIIARTAALAGDAGQPAFAEYVVEPSAGLLTYSSLMSAEDCAVIDASAYEDARTWFLEGGSDPTLSGGVSLGRSFELVATTTLVSHRRAAFVLRKIMERDGGSIFRLRGVGDEWRSAAVELGARVVVDDAIAGPATGPGIRVSRPSASERFLAMLVGRSGRERPRTVILDTPRWSLAYDRALLRSGGVCLVNPGARVLLDTLLHARSAQSSWLADAATGPSGLVSVEDSPTAELSSLRRGFEPLVPALGQWVEAGRRLGGKGVVAVATQDVSPPARAFLLGFKASGGLIITLEHGISGAYSTEVYSVADVLGAWGEPQAAYHRQAGPPGLDVEAVGWPRLESVYSLRPAQTDAAWDLIFFAQPSVSLSSGDWPEDNLRALSAIDTYAGAHRDRRVAIKLHPATGAYGAGVPPMGYAKTVSGDSTSLVRSARIVAISLSTTGIEAMAMGRPVIQMSRKGVLGAVEFISQSGAALGVGSGQELEAAVETLLTDPAAYDAARGKGLDYAREFVRGVDSPGSAERRFVEIVQELGARRVEPK